jgi:hypothetical protein
VAEIALVKGETSALDRIWMRGQTRTGRVRFLISGIGLATLARDDIATRS